jgi:hypothetical protein
MKKLYTLSFSLLLTSGMLNAQEIEPTKRVKVEFQTGDIVTSTTGQLSVGKIDKSSIPYQDEITAIFILKDENFNVPRFIEKGIAVVKFTSINGNVKKGDYLTTSEISGTAMKATQSGMTIGVALEDSKEGKELIKVLVQPFWIKF